VVAKLHDLLTKLNPPIQSVIATVMQLVDSLCGLIPEAHIYIMLAYIDIM